MSENIIPIVELNGGLRAAFINLPHFRNTAIQIVVNAGSMHEQPNEYGSAHLLEHLAFQGTEKFETNAILERHRRHVDVQLDAYTSSTRTVYEASGSRLESALQLVGQLALYPLHNYNHLEKEREPILEEIKQERYNSFRYANERHNAIIGGLRYARGIAGTEQNVLSLTSDQLTRFYDRHYNLKNISLVVCSPEPITLQRKLTEILLLNRNDQEGATPTLLKLPWFTSVKSNTASLEYVQIDQEAPTDLTLHIESNKSSSEKDIIIDSLTALALSIAVHKKGPQFSIFCACRITTTY
jgi:predicted Zn-dependent peptidase